MATLRNKWTLIALAVVMAAGSGAVVLWKNKLRKRPNVLVLSGCSLRWDFLDNGKPPHHLEEFYKRSVVFENAFTGKSWSNVSGFLYTIPADIYEENHYHPIGLPWPYHKKKYPKDTPSYFMRTPSDFDKVDYQADLNRVKSEMTNRANWPFLLEYHVKMAHEPYSYADWKKGRMDSLALLSEDKRAYLDAYFQHPERYPERVMLSILLEMHTVEKTKAMLKYLPLKMDPEIREGYTESSMPVLIGLITNPHLTELWRRSPYFQKDLEIVKEVYRIHLRYFDDYIAPLLDLFGDPELAANTVIIFTGDHGEAFGEHGEFGHGNTNYDEMLRFPMAIHFPGETNPRRISTQVYQGSIAEAVQAIMSGALTRENFPQFIAKKMDDPYIISNNCETTQFAVRFANRWKFVLSPATSERQLFDLQTDSGEKVNVESANPTVSAGLEEYLLNHLDSFHFNKIISHCAGDL